MCFVTYHWGCSPCTPDIHAWNLSAGPTRRAGAKQQRGHDCSRSARMENGSADAENGCVLRVAYPKEGARHLRCLEGLGPLQR